MHRPAPGGAVRPDARATPRYTTNHRYARPRAAYVRTHPAAYRPVPHYRPYRAAYSRWYVHPYWRWRHATIGVSVAFGYAVNPWVTVWVPPARPGWRWIPGAYVGPVWYPGYWAPVRTVVVPGYVYVPGYWVGSSYIEGYYRADGRDGWEWVEGFYTDDGTYVRGHWAPRDAAPEGYVWEPGFWDGEQWVEGFWRPTYRGGYRWVSAYYDEDGVFNNGYWEPIEERPGMVWVPGWFDGTTWVEGYWVSEIEASQADPDTWQPEAGWDAGWDEGDDVRWADPAAIDEGDHAPLALPVPIDEEEL